MRADAPDARRVLMEVHANSNYRMFVDQVLPNATALRARYAACQCSFALSVLVRCARTPPPGARSSRWQ